MSWILQKLRGYYAIWSNGVPLPSRPALNIIGPVPVDNPQQNRTDLDLSNLSLTSGTFGQVTTQTLQIGPTTFLSGTLVTLDATPTAIFSCSLPSGQGAVFTVNLVAEDGTHISICSGTNAISAFGGTFAGPSLPVVFTGTFSPTQPEIYGITWSAGTATFSVVGLASTTIRWAYSFQITVN